MKSFSRCHPEFRRRAGLLRWAGWAVVALLLLPAIPAQAQSLGSGQSAYQRQDYVTASRIFIPFAERGNAAAQTYLGFLFETGRGVPQNYT